MSLESAIAKLTTAVEANTAAIEKGSAPVPVVASLPTAPTPVAPRKETAPAADPLAGIGAVPSTAIDIMAAAAVVGTPVAVDKATVIDLAQQVGAQKGRAVLVELFAKFGADNFPKIKATDYAAFANACRAALK